VTAPARLYELVEQFEREHAAYRSGDYNEAQVRVEFINPLFDELLGWDKENRQGRPVAYRDVVYEDRGKIGGYTKAPDYGFYIDGARKFFLEAKKPSVDIGGDGAVIQRCAAVLSTCEDDALFRGRDTGWEAKLPRWRVV
jgi:hypothetical protein